jgi:GNAT superfamily N-acetyltransferase
MLVEGFDRRSCFFTYYNHPYYIDHLTALGYGKDVDWVENYITVPYDEKTLNRWQKLSDFVLKRYHLHLVEAKNRLAYIPLLKKFFKLVNTAYAPLYGTVELTEEQIKKYSAKFAPLINPKLAGFVMDENNEMVGMGVGAPSIASALQKSRGRLLPFGWVGLLKAFRKNDTIDLLLIAVDPKYQGKGVNAAVINKVVHGCVEMGITHAETGPMLETNEKVQDQWKGVPLEQHKRRRCFIKRIAE